MNAEQAKILGQKGENIACDYLASKGFSIAERNWRFGRIEIDIICHTQDFIIFIEVKTRENRFLGEPWEAVTRSKQRRIIKAADAYLIENDIPLGARFDIISIVHNQKITDIEHLEDAYYAML